MRLSPFAALRDLRVGCVPYLNARPLIYALPGEITLAHPSKLADLLQSGAIEVALVPIFAAFGRADFKIADGVAIAAHGEVYSVFMAYRGSLGEVKSVALDPASCTSCQLLKCLLAEFHGLRPEYVAPDAAEAQLLIGNQAIEFREKHGTEFSYLDLGADWMRWTGLPFVFAVWLMRGDLPNSSAIADALRESKREGLKFIQQIAHEQRDFSPAFAEHYLRRHIQFDLGVAEKAGIRRFQELLVKHGLMTSASEPQFV